MADASKQLDIPDARDTTSATETLAADRALSRARGGTGVSAASKAALAAEYVATGASAGAAGTSGMVPIAAAGDQRKALRGDETFSTELHLTKVVDAAGAVARVATSGLLHDTGEQVLDIEITGDGLNRLYVNAAGSTTNRARIGARGTDLNIDLVLEPKNYGRLTQWGDPLVGTIKPMRRVTARAFDSTFDTIGLPAVTVDTPGAAAVSLDDDDGTYVQLATGATLGNVAGIQTSLAVAKRRLDPEFVAVFRSAIIQSRLWFGLFTADPSTYTDVDFGSSGVQGFGFYYDDFLAGPNTGTSPLISDVTVAAAGKTYTRASGDYLADGFRNGQSVTWAGWSASGGTNNGTKTITALSATVMTVAETCVNEGPGISVQCTGPTTAQWRAVTSSSSAATFTHVAGADVQANAIMGLRARFVASNTPGASAGFEFGFYNFTTKVWENWTVHESASASVPAATAALKLYARLRTGSATNRTIGIKTFDIYSE